MLTKPKQCLYIYYETTKIVLTNVCIQKSTFFHKSLTFMKSYTITASVTNSFFVGLHPVVIDGNLRCDFVTFSTKHNKLRHVILLKTINVVRVRFNLFVLCNKVTFLVLRNKLGNSHTFPTSTIAD